jgi:hypothetical protein
LLSKPPARTIGLRTRLSTKVRVVIFFMFTSAKIIECEELHRGQPRGFQAMMI